VKPVYDLSWGCPVIVRQALAETLGDHFLTNNNSIASLGYTSHLGSLKLIEQMKDLAQRLSGHRPKHLVVTCGATGALNAALYALKDTVVEFVVTDNRYYPIIPKIITVAGLDMINRDQKEKLVKNGYGENKMLSLVASPSAPEGLICPFESVDIYDAAYASRTYGKPGGTPAKYKLMCGSLSKILGLSGLRLGWASTDDDILYNYLSRYAIASYAGLPSVSMAIAEDVLDRLNLDRFEIKSSNYLDDNRGEMQRLLDRFGQDTVPTRGMFATLQLGKAERKALMKAGIKWQCGSSWGADSDWARLSLGQTREVVRAAVRTALK